MEGRGLTVQSDTSCYDHGCDLQGKKYEKVPLVILHQKVQKVRFMMVMNKFPIEETITNEFLS